MFPDRPKLDLPSDLFGVVIATYDAERSRASASDRAAAVQAACQQIRDVIREQWEILEKREAGRQARIRASKESQAVMRLHTVSTRLRDALMALQRDSFAAFSDRAAFEEVKKKTAEEMHRIVGEFGGDAGVIGAHQELEQLRAAATFKGLRRMRLGGACRPLPSATANGGTDIPLASKKLRPGCRIAFLARWSGPPPSTSLRRTLANDALQPTAHKSRRG